MREILFFRSTHHAPPATRRPSRSAFTLVELLTAMAIVTILAAIAIPVVATMIRGDRVRRGSLLVQGALINARERAALDGLPRGVRFVPDDERPELCRQIVFIREGDPISTGRCVVTASTAAGLNATSGGVVFDLVGLPANEINLAAFNALPRGYASNVMHGWNNSQYAIRGAIRFERAGKLYSFSMPIQNNPSAVQPTLTFTAGNIAYVGLVLDQPIPELLPVDTGAIANPTLANLALRFAALSYEIARPPVPLEGVDPVILPSYTVVDLGQLPQYQSAGAQGWVDDSYNRLTRLTPRLPQGHLDPETNVFDFGFEILFSPDGRVIGNAATDERVMIWVRDENNVQTTDNPNWQVVPPANGGSGRARKEISANSTGGNSLVVLSPRTGFMGTFKPVLQDALTYNQNGTWSPGPDGLFDWNAYYDNVLNNIGVND